MITGCVLLYDYNYIFIYISKEAAGYWVRSRVKKCMNLMIKCEYAGTLADVRDRRSVAFLCLSSTAYGFIFVVHFICWPIIFFSVCVSFHFYVCLCAFVIVVVVSRRRQGQTWHAQQLERHSDSQPAS